jgi:CheY-like chemotaxis protein
LEQQLKGSRVLVVEDEYFIAQDMSHALLALGAEVVGPAGTLSHALQLLEEDPPDFAVLDINLQGEVSFAVARRAAANGIPFVFATGYEQGVLPPDLQHAPLWKKPFDTDALAAAVVQVRGSAN